MAKEYVKELTLGSESPVGGTLPTTSCSSTVTRWLTKHPIRLLPEEIELYFELEERADVVHEMTIAGSGTAMTAEARIAYIEREMEKRMESAPVFIPEIGLSS